MSKYQDRLAAMAKAEGDIGKLRFPARRLWFIEVGWQDYVSLSMSETNAIRRWLKKRRKRELRRLEEQS